MMTKLNGRDSKLVEAVVHAVDARFESRFAGLHEDCLGLRRATRRAAPPGRVHGLGTSPTRSIAA